MIICHLFEVKQLLCTNVAYTGNAYWVFVPLGLPAQKGWEVYSPLPGSHHPRLSGKITRRFRLHRRLYFIEVKQLLCTDVAYTGFPTHQSFRFPAQKREDKDNKHTDSHQPSALCAVSLHDHSSSQPLVILNLCHILIFIEREVKRFSRFTIRIFSRVTIEIFDDG